MSDKPPLLVVGLGKMGGRMATKLVREGHEVYGWDISEGSRRLARDRGINTPESIEEAVSSLPYPGHRIVLQMLPAGEITEESLKTLEALLTKGDIIIDGGNSKYQDTERHARDLSVKGLRFLGMGVSGGIIAEKTGYPLMIGGDRNAYDEIFTIFDSLAKPNGGHQYFGTGGAGHYVKMVHNGIEYPIMQAFGEGFGVMQASEYGLDLIAVAKLFQKGTLVSGFMNDRMVEALEADPDLGSYDGEIGSASGEAIWTVDEAKKLDVPVESIQQSIDYRVRSVTEQNVKNSFAAKVVAALRATFGGHPVKRH
jgi:6-phosphogluconate dehydrogenase